MQNLITVTPKPADFPNLELFLLILRFFSKRCPGTLSC